MKNTIILLLSTLLFASQGIAQDSLLIEKIISNCYPLQLSSEGQLSGKGFDLLDRAAEQSPFFLIGEAHGVAEIPLFTAALFDAFKKHGYRYFATETGPYTARFLEDLSRQKDWAEQLETFFQIYPWSIPFYSWQEEGEILETVMENSTEEIRLLWGLDQEFAASFRMHFNDLQKRAKTSESKAMATKYYDQAMLAFKTSSESRNPSDAFMAQIKKDDFEVLKQAFTGQEDGLDLLRELEESIHIYQLWFQRKGYTSNALRAEMMKQHFWQYYRKAKANGGDPKVMFKLGANHTYRGANALNVFDIGNFVSELASQMNKKSFHLYILSKRGTVNAHTPFSASEADKQKPYNAPDYFSEMDVSSLLVASPDTTWSVVNLLPIRKALFNRSLKDVDPGLAKLIWSYDAILVIPEVSAATYYND
ncbi:MAG: hypothetical protein AAF985_09510 [Bacteroidota bacterium]